jgi:hypothetical protein
MKKSGRLEQFDRDKERQLLGTRGAASEVRKIDLASVDTAALVERLGAELKRQDRRSALYIGKQPDEPAWSSNDAN